jgi:hypothetical protein
MIYYLQDPVDQKSLENLREHFIWLSEEAENEKKHD